MTPRLLLLPSLLVVQGCSCRDEVAVASEHLPAECVNGADDDNDGRSDCDDPGCAEVDACVPACPPGSPSSTTGLVVCGRFTAGGATLVNPDGLSVSGSLAWAGTSTSGGGFTVTTSE